MVDFPITGHIWFRFSLSVLYPNMVTPSDRQTQPFFELKGLMEHAQEWEARVGVVFPANDVISLALCQACSIKVGVEKLLIFFPTSRYVVHIHIYIYYMTACHNSI